MSLIEGHNKTASLYIDMGYESRPIEASLFLKRTAQIDSLSFRKRNESMGSHVAESRYVSFLHPPSNCHLETNHKQTSRNPRNAFLHAREIKTVKILIRREMGRFVVIVLCSVVILISVFGQFGVCRGDDDRITSTTLGGYRDRGTIWNSVDIESLARFAVQEHNKRENALLEFSRVLKAREQTVAGKLYHLTLEVNDNGNKKIYKAKVWVKPWMNFKRLEEFKPVELNSSVRLEFDAKSDGDEFKWRSVPANSPEVQEAANHAVNSIQQRSNSLYPYRLLEILAARTKVLEDSVKFELLLKLCRGDQQETSRVEVTKKHDGKFY